MLQFAFVRRSSLAILLCAALAAARAETIHLKNGGTILADSVTESNGRVEYQIGDDTYALPKSAIDRIDTGGAPVRSSGLRDAPPLTTPLESVPRSSEVQDKLIRDGHVDQQAIAKVEEVGSSELSAAANFTAGNFEYQQGDRELARRYFERALMFSPDTPGILDMYVATLIQLHMSQQAIPYAERATRLSPTSADSFYLLGRAYFESDRTAEAIKAWKKSVELRPDASVSAELARAERESSAEGNFTETDTGHFTFHYEGRQTSPELRRQIMDTLESDYNALVGELGVAPHDSISVSLYTNQAFFDVTQAPNWASALYDGKLRIPVDGLTGVTPSLARVLKHELTHSFIRDITHGRCPQWLNEGVAMSEEPRALSPSLARQLAGMYAAQHQLPLSSLEGSFVNLGDFEARMAYVESLAATLYIRDTYSMGDVQRLLQRIGEGSSTEAAMRSTFHSGYADFEQELGRYLARNYGP